MTFPPKTSPIWKLEYRPR